MEASNLDDVCACVGYTATRRLAAWYGGRNLYVPAAARGDHPLAGLLGMPALRALVAQYAGEQLTIPPASEDDRFRRDRRIAIALVAGQTCAEIAADLDLTTRRVEQIRGELVVSGLLEYAASGRRGRALRDPAIA